MFIRNATQIRSFTITWANQSDLEGRYIQYTFPRRAKGVFFWFNLNIIQLFSPLEIEWKVSDSSYTLTANVHTKGDFFKENMFEIVASEYWLNRSIIFYGKRATAAAEEEIENKSRVEVIRVVLCSPKR